MFPYIVCYCGRSLGDIYPVFKEMRKQRYQEYLKKDSDIEIVKLMTSTKIDVKLGDILDALNINCECCRVRLLTQVEYSEYY